MHLMYYYSVGKNKKLKKYALIVACWHSIQYEGNKNGFVKFYTNLLRLIHFPLYCYKIVVVIQSNFCDDNGAPGHT